MTDAGLGLQGVLRAHMRRVEAQALTGFGADELERMGELLQRMKDNLAGVRDDASG